MKHFTVFVFLCFGAVLFQIQQVNCDVFSPSDENESTVLDEFLVGLQFKSGLNNENNKYKIQVKCDGETKDCIINANGTAVWDARFTLYESFVGDNTEEQTLDDCLNNSTADDLQTCLITVRTKMLEKLNNDFENNLISLIQNDGCAVFSDNCT